MGVPVLGLCYGAQLMMHVLGGKVERADVREYGKTEVLIDKTQSKIFADVSPKTVCWMSHFDYISQVAPGFEISSHTKDCPCASAENERKRKLLCNTVPSRSTSHTGRNKDVIQLRSWSLPVFRRLENGFICRRIN